MPSPLDDLRKAPDAFGNPYADLTHDFSLPSEKAAAATQLQEASQPDTQQRQVNRFKAADLAERGIPAYKTPSGDVTAVTDETGAALLGKQGDIAYDSKGQPRQIAYGETGPPVLKDPFAALPSRTDPKTGAIEKYGPGGLYQYQGQDPVIAQAALQQEKDKAVAKESALVGRKLTLDEHDLTTGTKEHKALTTDLQAQVPSLIDPKFAGADQGTVMKAIEDHFNAQYASPDANAKSGFFGNGALTPEAATRRQSIDTAKARAVDTATNLYGLKDTLNGLSETVAAGRQTQRDQVETLLAHQRGEEGPLDRVASNDAASGPAPGLYPPKEAWSRMGVTDPDAQISNPAVASKVASALPPSAAGTLEIPKPGSDGKPEAEGFWATMGREFGTKIIPGIATGAGGLAAGLAAIPSGPGAVAADIAAGTAAGIGASKAQRAVMGETWAKANEAQMDANAREHPVAAQIGSMVPFLVSLFGGGGAAVRSAAGKLIGKATTAAGKAAIEEAIATGVKYQAPMLERVATSAAMGGRAGLSQGAQEQFVEGKDVNALDVAARSAVSFGATGLFAPAKTLLGAVLGRSVSDSAAMTLAGEMYDAGVHGKPFDLAQTAKEIGGDIPAFALQNLLLGFLHHGISSSGPGGDYGLGGWKFGRKPPEPPPGTPPDVATELRGLAKTDPEAFKKRFAEEVSKRQQGEYNVTPPTAAERLNIIDIRLSQMGKDPFATQERESLQREKDSLVNKTPETKGPTPKPPEPPPVEPGKAASNDATSLATAEQNFVEKGGHADKLDAQNKLTALREAFPEPAARIAAIDKHLAPTTIDEAAHEAATSPKNGLAEPTQPQKEAGNYQKGHETIAGLDVAIENPAGSKRHPDWPPLKSHYGYIKGTVGADKDHVDIFIKEGTPTDYNGPVYVVNQHNKDGGFDEHKAVMGVSSLADAKAEYNANYEKAWTGGKSVVEFPNPAAFKEWATSGHAAKGKPAIDPRLSPTVGKVAAELHLSYNGKDAAGQHLFSDTSSDRPSTFSVVPGTVASVEAKAIVAKAKEVRERMAGTPEQRAQAAAIAKRKAEREAKNEQPISGNTGRAGTASEAADRPVEKRDDETRGSGLAEKAPTESGNAETGGRVRISTPEESKSGLEKSKQVHAAEIAELGAPHTERVLGRTGLATEQDGSAIVADHKALAQAAAIIHDNGGDSQKWLEDAHKEELIHYRDVKASGKIRNLTLGKVWVGVPKEAQAAVRELYPDTQKITHLSAEYIRMVAQYRALGRITESHFRDTSRMEMFLKARQSQALETHLKAMAAVSRVASNDATLPAKSTLLLGRSGALAERLNALEVVKPTDAAVIKTLLGSSSKTALDQAESRIAKLENQNATTSGEQQSSEGGKLPRVPPRTDLRPHKGEIREETGGQAGGGSGPLERPPTPAEQPSIRQPETSASQELIDKGKKAFEGLFAGLPRYEAQVATKDAQVSEGDVEELRKSNEARLSGLKPENPSEPLGAAKPVAIEQQPIPKDKRVPMFDLIDAMEKEGITTPEKVSGYLDAISGGKARPFSQSLWDMMAAAGAVPRGTHDWPTIYLTSTNASSDAKGDMARMPAENVTRAVRNKLLTGQSVDRRALTELANGNQVSPKEADEAAEVAIVEVARMIATGEGTTEEKFDKLVDLYNRQPNLTAKTSTSKVNQAYSTPAPLAFAASYLADITGGKRVYEPTAGNGMLLIEADPAKAVVNELDPARATALKLMGHNPYVEDATRFTPKGIIDRVIANPPFGTVITEDQSKKEWPLSGTDETTREIDHAISLKALSAMQDDGRAVLILGGKNKLLKGDARAEAYTRGDGAKFWKALYDQYRVVDHLTLNGDLYTKQGAGWPIDVVVIAGRGKSPIQLPSADGPRIINTWDDLRTELGRSDSDRIAAGRYDPEKDREKLGGIIGAIRGIASADAPTGRKGSSKQPAGQPGTGATSTYVARPDQGQQPDVSRGPEPSDVGPAREPGPVGLGAAPGQPEQSRQLSEDYRVPYRPASKLPSFKIFVPTNMDVPAREALQRLEAQVGPIDDYVRGKLGYRSDAPLDRYFSAEQMDALALGVHAIENQTAFVLGDQGGVGKGRVAAGMMAYAIHQGKLPIFITKDVKLYAAMIEDLHDIGKDDITPLFTDNDISFLDYSERKWKQGNMTKVMREVAKTGKLPGAEALFTTYSQIASDVPPKYSANKAERYAMKAKHQAPPDGARMEALKKLAPGSVIIADESHLAAGDSIRAWRLGPLLAQAHGVYYSSATFAKRPDSMGIYSRTSLSHATQSIDDLVDAMKQGGVPLQQVVSATLAADGLYLRRERDFSKAVFRTHINLDTKERDTRLADNYTDGIRSILAISNKMDEARKYLNRILRRLGKKMQVANAPKIETTNFASKLHNLISQYLFAIKAESMVRRAVEGVTKGFTNVEGETKPHKVIVAFQNTMEQPILALENSRHPLTFNGMLMQYLDSQRELKTGRGNTAKVTRITDKPDPRFENLDDGQLEKILIASVVMDSNGETTGVVNEEALAELFRRIMAGVFKQTEEKLAGLDLADMLLSPIDHIKRQLTLAGIKSAEITKRGTGIDEDGALYKLHPSSNTKAAHLRYLSDFNNSDTDVLLINASGSTGISAHSSAKFKRTDPRAMIIGQPHLDINEFMQTTYRIDRTGQVHQPYYELLQTAIPAELRPAAILGKKMSKLNANTTSNAESEISAGNKGTDIFNQYGDEVVYNYLKSDPYFTQMLDMPKIMDGEGNILPIRDAMANYEEDGQFAAAVTGRAAVLPTVAQEIFWEKVMADYVAHINYLNELGENELVSDTVDLKAETLESKELTPAKKGDSGFDAPSHMEKIKADIGLKPLPATEVIQMMNALDGDAIKKGWSASFDAWKTAELTRLSEKILSWDDEKSESYQARWREQAEEISAALSLIGTGLHIKTDKGMDGYGAITDVHLDPDHPQTPSKQIFVIHVNTTKKTIRVPASQLPTIAREAVGKFEDVYESTAERSNQRYMITGNLLAAYLAIKDAAPNAKIVNYTTDKGDLRQGILMPAKFTPGALSKKRVVESAKHMLELLLAGRSLNNAGSELTIVKAPSGGFVIRVPASRVMGGAYWRDSQLAKLMEGKEFVERGGAMIGKFNLDNSHLVYQRLLDLQATLFYTEQDAEPLGAARPIRAAVALKDALADAAKGAGLTVKESFQLLQHLVSPMTGVAMDAQDQVMRMLGERNQKAYQTDRVLEAASASFDAMPRPEQVAFIDRMKKGEAQPSPELQAIADVMRKIDTESWDAAVAAYKALGFKEPPLKWLENHYRVLWKKIPGSTDEEKAAWIGKAKRGLRGSMGQHKQHTLETMSDGLDMGGIPYSYNPVTMFKLAQADLWKLTTTLKTWKWAKDNGFVEFVRGAFPKAPDGMVQLDDSIANVYFPAESGEGLVHAGKYFVEEGFGRLLNNYLSRDYIRQVRIGRGLLWLKNATTSLELSLSAFHGMFETAEAIGSNIGLGLSKLVNRGLLKGDLSVAASGVKDILLSGASPYIGNNLGRQIRRAAVDPAAFFATSEGQAMEKRYPGARQAVNALFVGGWKPNELEQDWKNNSIRTFVDAVADIKAGDSDNYIGAGLRAFPAANEMLMKPLFDHYIPNLKVAQFFKEFLEAKQQNERKLRGGVLTEAALARQVWRFVEDRFGEMNFDTLFWNSNFKTAMQLMFRSVTWKLGSVEAFAGAFGGQAKEFKDAFNERRAPELHRNTAWLFGMFLLTATLGYIMSELLGNKRPKNLTDYVFPQIDPKDDKTRVSLPTYFKDLVHLMHAPGNYVISSMSGWIGRVADLLRNKDYFGVQIRDTDDPVTKQALQVGKYVGETVLPFSVRGYRNLSAQDVGSLRKLLAIVGINPAPRYIGQSAAERKSEEFLQGQRSESGMKPEQFEKATEKRKLVAQLRHGEQPDISKALASGVLKPRDVKPLYQRAQMGALASQMLHMPLEEAERIYILATPQEKLQLEPVIAKKRANSYKRNKTPFTGF